MADAKVLVPDAVIDGYINIYVLPSDESQMSVYNEIIRRALDTNIVSGGGGGAGRKRGQAGNIKKRGLDFVADSPDIKFTAVCHVKDLNYPVIEVKSCTPLTDIRQYEALKSLIHLMPIELSDARNGTEVGLSITVLDTTAAAFLQKDTQDIGPQYRLSLNSEQRKHVKYEVSPMSRFYSYDIGTPNMLNQLTAERYFRFLFAEEQNNIFQIPNSSWWSSDDVMIFYAHHVSADDLRTVKNFISAYPSLCRLTVQDTLTRHTPPDAVMFTFEYVPHKSKYIMLGYLLGRERKYKKLRSHPELKAQKEFLSPHGYLNNPVEFHIDLLCTSRLKAFNSRRVGQRMFAALCHILPKHHPDVKMISLQSDQTLEAIAFYTTLGMYEPGLDWEPHQKFSPDDMNPPEQSVLDQRKAAFQALRTAMEKNPDISRESEEWRNFLQYYDMRAAEKYRTGIVFMICELSDIVHTLSKEGRRLHVAPISVRDYEYPDPTTTATDISPLFGVVESSRDTKPRDTWIPTWAAVLFLSHVITFSVLAGLSLFTVVSETVLTSHSNGSHIGRVHIEALILTIFALGFLAEFAPNYIQHKEMVLSCRGLVTAILLLSMEQTLFSAILATAGLAVLQCYYFEWIALLIIYFDRVNDWEPWLHAVFWVVLVLRLVAEKYPQLSSILCRLVVGWTIFAVHV